MYVRKNTFVCNYKQIFCLQNVPQVRLDQIYQTKKRSSSCHFAMLLT